MGKHPFVVNPLEEGTINLMASVAFNEPFWNVSDLTDQNSYKININESQLFNQLTEKQMMRFYELEDERFKELEWNDAKLAKEIFEEEKWKHDVIIGKIEEIKVDDEEILPVSDDEDDKPLEEEIFFDANQPVIEELPEVKKS